MNYFKSSTSVFDNTYLNSLINIIINDLQRSFNYISIELLHCTVCNIHRMFTVEQIYHLRIISAKILTLFWHGMLTCSLFWIWGYASCLRTIINSVAHDSKIIFICSFHTSTAASIQTLCFSPTPNTCTNQL